MLCVWIHDRECQTNDKAYVTLIIYKHVTFLDDTQTNHWFWEVWNLWLTIKNILKPRYDSWFWQLWNIIFCLLWGWSRGRWMMSRAWGMFQRWWITIWRIRLERLHTRKSALGEFNKCLTYCKKFNNRHNKHIHKCFIYSWCGSVFNQEKKLKEHKIFEHGGKQCPQCGIKIADRTKYNIHVPAILYIRHVKDVHTEAESSVRTSSRTRNTTKNVLPLRHNHIFNIRLFEF